ncbi:hypothetical protein [Enterococcus villorum]|uniref:hypothetical protein n=1 Tax=Enterococcus villorum TaxID=112904 RepID=UPI0019D37FEE|nr:hypothetical protein [Enterococcus villorum]
MFEEVSVVIIGSELTVSLLLDELLLVTVDFELEALLWLDELTVEDVWIEVSVVTDLCLATTFFVPQPTNKKTDEINNNPNFFI